MLSAKARYPYLRLVVEFYIWPLKWPPVHGLDARLALWEADTPLGLGKGGTSALRWFEKALSAEISLFARLISSY